MDMVKFLLISYACLFGGVLLLMKCIELFREYIKERNLLNTLNRIESKVDQLPGVDKDKEDEWYWSIK